jgi:hypothetical protein
MAIDQTNVALDIAARAVQQATALLEAFEELEDILTHATQAGINMTSFDAALAESSVKHTDGATINKLAVIIPALQTYLNGTSTGGTTYKQVLYKLRQ